MVQYKEQVVGRNLITKLKDIWEDYAWRWRNQVQPAMYAPWYFAKNVWRFRKELWNFRRFDYSYNLQIFVRSLKLTSEFMASDGAVSMNASKDAQDIQKFIRYLEIYANPMEEAERQTGLNFMKLYERFPERFGGSEEENPELAKLLKLSNQIEARSWKNAWRLIARRGQCWWD